MAAGLDGFDTAAGGDISPPDPVAPTPAVAKEQTYRMYLSLPLDVVGKLRKRAVQQGLIEGRRVSVNDIILKTLRDGLQ
jgi:hypothetical protein